MRIFLPLLVVLAGCGDAPIPFPPPCPDGGAIIDASHEEDASAVLDAAVAPDFSATAVLDLTAPPDLSSRWSVDLGGRPLRILPLGDSITEGLGGATANSYRKALWDGLTAAGVSVDFVGALSHGDSTLPDLNHEGHAGWSTIDMLAIQNPGYVRRSNASIFTSAQAPDIVLLAIGTNDCFAGGSPAGGWEPESVPEAVVHVAHVVASAAPGALVLVGSIPPIPAASPNGMTTYYPLANACVIAANARLPGLIEAERAQGANLRFVDRGLVNADVCNTAGSGGWPGSIGGDCIHPNTIGYEHDGAAWAAAVLAAL